MERRQINKRIVLKIKLLSVSNVRPLFDANSFRYFHTANQLKIDSIELLSDSIIVVNLNTTHLLHYSEMFGFHDNKQALDLGVVYGEQ